MNGFDVWHPRDPGPLRPRRKLTFGNPSQGSRKVEESLPGKGNSNSHGARPVHLIITMMMWIHTSRLSIKNSLYQGSGVEVDEGLRVQLEAMGFEGGAVRAALRDCANDEVRILLKVRAVPIGTVLNLRATTSQKCEAVPRRARM